MIAKVNPKEILSDILENIEGDIDGLEEKILITTSCKASVKAGQKLSTWQMQEIIKKWRTTQMPYTCPHGRPISKFFPHKQIASFSSANHRLSNVYRIIPRDFPPVMHYKRSTNYISSLARFN